MANPQPDKSFGRRSNQITEQLIFRQFTRNQQILLNFILRFSWDCGKKYAIIPKRFFSLCIHRNYAAKELKKLEVLKIISINGDYYTFNKNFDEWLIPLNADYLKRLNKEINVNSDVKQLLALNLYNEKLDYSDTGSKGQQKDYVFEGQEEDIDVEHPYYVRDYSNCEPESDPLQGLTPKERMEHLSRQAAHAKNLRRTNNCDENREIDD